MLNILSVKCTKVLTSLLNNKTIFNLPQYDFNRKIHRVFIDKKYIAVTGFGKSLFKNAVVKKTQIRIEHNDANAVRNLYVELSTGDYTVYLVLLTFFGNNLPGLQWLKISRINICEAA